MPFDPPVTTTTLLRHLKDMLGVMKEKFGLFSFIFSCCFQSKVPVCSAAFRASETKNLSLETVKKGGKDSYGEDKELTTSQTPQSFSTEEEKPTIGTFNRYEQPLSAAVT